MEREVIFLFVEKLKSNWLLIVLGSVVIIFLFINRDTVDEFSANAVLTSEEDAQDEVTIDTTETEAIVIVDIKGEVEQPGVYEVDSQSRVNDAIQLAGGFTSEANEFVVNLAQKVHDEMTIVVPSLTDDGEPNGQHTNSNNVIINTASKEDLESLNGIGPSKA